MKTIFSVSLLIVVLGLSACTQAPAALAPTSEPATGLVDLIETATLPPTSTSTATETQAPTQTSTPTQTPSPIPSETPTPEPTATYAILRGKINVEKVSCRYGPGAMYLYLYGMVQGANQDVIGRNDNGTWALTCSRGDTLSCWVRTDLMDLNGDILSVAPINPDDYNLPMSPYYGPLTNVTAKRNGTEVIVSWNPLILRAGDDSEQTPYVLQVWVCRGGEIVMESIGAYETTASVIDESGCSQPSRGLITAAEKHGYTRFVEIPWP